jgi:hypothetical protein
MLFRFLRSILLSLLRVVLVVLCITVASFYVGRMYWSISSPMVYAQMRAGEKIGDCLAIGFLLVLLFSTLVSGSIACILDAWKKAKNQKGGK